ncbi:MAG: ABC transporter substrate-binding protein [Chloroflexi bacterium]|nr:ABC transporter substrate-binding protein [Chloroflexota bacterium]
MSRRSSSWSVPRAGAVALLVAALGSPVAAQSPAAPVTPETTSFQLAIGGPGLSTVGILATVADLNQQGWQIETPELSAGELQLQGVASGQFQMSSGQGPGVLLAVQQGLPVKIPMSRIKNEWTLYSKSEITECAQLDGSRLAIHSEGSPATFMVRDWIAQNCPGITPNYIILPGSENRYAALLAGEIDASPIELPDAIALEAEAGDRFGRLTSFAETLPDLLLTPIYVNSDWAAANPNTVSVFLEELLQQHRKFNADAEYFKARVLEVLPATDPARVDASVAAYRELEMYDPNGGIAPEQQQFTIDFVTNAGGIEPGLAPEQAFDRTYLDAALDRIGRQ